MKKSYPKRIYITINNVCNARCKMCDIGQQNIKGRIYKSMKDSESDMPLELFKKLVDDLKECGAYIDIKGTEPLLKHDLLDFVRYAKQNNLGCNITTNGFFLEKFAKDFVEVGLDDLQVSLDGPEKICDEVRGVPGIFKRATNAIKEIVRLKKELNVDKPVIRINYTVSNLNYQYLGESLKIFKDLGVDIITFQHLVFITKQVAQIHNSKFSGPYSVCESSITDIIDPEKVDIEVLHSQIEKIKKDFKNSKGTAYKFIPDMTKEELHDYYKHGEKFVGNCSGCKYASWSAGIKSNGDVIPHVRCYNIVFGNINNESILDIWNNQKYEDFRKVLSDNGGALPACARCCGIVKSEQLDNSSCYTG